MQLNEYNVLKNTCSLISYSDLQNKSERTLLYGFASGFTRTEEKWHIYILNITIHKFIYTFVKGKVYPIEYKKNQLWDIHELVINKHFYPECCDFEFCSLLKTNGGLLNFTSFCNIVIPQYYYGELYVN